MDEDYAMRVRIQCNGTEVPVGAFVARFVGNVCAAIASSLRGPLPEAAISFEIRPEGVRCWMDGFDIGLDGGRGFAATLVRGTLSGLTAELKGVDSDGVVRIEVELA